MLWIAVAFMVGLMVGIVAMIDRRSPSMRFGRVVISVCRRQGRLVGSIYFGSYAAIHWRCRDGRWLMYEKALR